MLFCAIPCCLVAVLFFRTLYRLLGKRGKRGRDWGEDRVVITGGCGQLGRALAGKLRQMGARVYQLDIRAGPHKDALECDASSMGSIKRAFGQISGPVSMIINNCGVYTGTTLVKLKDADFQRTIDVNFMSYVRMARFALPILEASPSHAPYIVNVASCLGLAGVPFMTDYCASKFAVYGFNEALRTELKVGGSRVRTLIVCPFFVRGGMFPAIRIRYPLLTRTLTADEVAEEIIRGVGEGREELWMPWFTRLVPLGRLLPTWLLDWAQLRVLATHESLPQHPCRQ